MRKGAALRSLERHAESIAAYQHALRIEPHNAQVQAALREVEALQRNSGRNWADDLNSTDDDEDKAPPSAVQQKPGQKRARAADQGDAGGRGAAQRSTPGGGLPTPAEVKRAQSLIDDSNANALRACLLQLAKGGAATCDRVCEMLEQLADKSSEGGGEGGSGASSADSDDV